MYSKTVLHKRVFIPDDFSKDQSLDKDKHDIFLDHIISTRVFKGKLLHPVDILSMPRPAHFSCLPALDLDNSNWTDNNLHTESVFLLGTTLLQVLWLGKGPKEEFAINIKDVRIVGIIVQGLQPRHLICNSIAFHREPSKQEFIRRSQKKWPKVYPTLDLRQSHVTQWTTLMLSHQASITG